MAVLGRLLCYCFFFSSRRRHTRSKRDWSSDVCSSDLTQVANLTYRTGNPAEAVESRLVGLGRNFSDYDQLTLRAGLLAGPGVLLQPEATLLRQGQGDFRLPYPPVAAYGTTPTLFAGVVERTVRLAVGATWQRGAWGLSGNGGVHFLHNAGHVTGVNDTKWVGSVTLSYRFHVEGVLP